MIDLLGRAEDGEESEATTGELTEFIEKAKMGEITNQDIPKFAKMFKVCRRGLFFLCWTRRQWMYHLLLCGLAHNSRRSFGSASLERDVATCF